MTNFGWRYLDGSKVIFECLPMPLANADRVFYKATGKDPKAEGITVAIRRNPKTEKEWQVWRKDFLANFALFNEIVFVKDKDNDGQFKQLKLIGDPEFVDGIGWYLRCKSEPDPSHKWNGLTCIDCLYFKYDRKCTN